MPDSRVTFRKRSPYATTRNRFKKVKTPGGRVAIQYIDKIAKAPRCGDTGAILHGLVVRRPKEYMRVSKPKKSVSRAYGGNLSGKAVRDRIVRAFLIEEQKIVKKVLKAQTQSK